MVIDKVKFEVIDILTTFYVLLVFLQFLHVSKLCSQETI